MHGLAEVPRRNVVDRRRPHVVEEGFERDAEFADLLSDLVSLCLGDDLAGTIGTAGIIVLRRGEAKRGLQRVALEIGGRAADRLDRVLVAAVVAASDEGVFLAVAVAMADDAGDCDRLARNRGGPEADGDAVLGE